MARTATILLALTMVLASCGDDIDAPLFSSNPPQPTLPGDTSGTTSLGGGDTPGTTDGDGGIGGIGELAATPLPIQEGLGTFDNYEWHMEISTMGPTAAETSITTTDWAFNRDPESRLSRTSMTQTGPDFEGAEESITELYQVGDESCQWDGESWTYEAATPQQREALEAMQRLFDVNVVPENPVAVGEEAVAGIDAVHYRFSVSGFGSESGALVTDNQVDYWIAKGTRVLLKYEIVLDSRSGPSDDPSAEVFRIEASAELRSANVPVAVTLSPDCLALATG